MSDTLIDVRYSLACRALGLEDFAGPQRQAKAYRTSISVSDINGRALLDPIWPDSLPLRTCSGKIPSVLSQDHSQCGRPRRAVETTTSRYCKKPLEV